jgi:CheY-like chemotaxis protein
MRIYQLILFALMNKDSPPVRMLVVDDDAVSRELLALLLTREGYAVEVADSGDAALDQLRRMQGALPAVVLTDIQMQGTTGGELAGELRSLCGAKTILLAMSGSEPEHRVQWDFDGFLLKPFTTQELAAAIAGVAVVSAAAANGKATALDEEIYEKLVNSMRKDQLEQLYALCLGDAEKRIAGMRRAASNGDDATYRKEAHAIKGGCGMVGAVELQTLASQMEEQGMIGTNHIATLNDFMLACERLRRILVAHEIRVWAPGISGERAR